MIREETVLTDDFKPFLKEFFNHFPEEKNILFEKFKVKRPSLKSLEEIFEIEITEFNDFDFIEMFEHHDFHEGKMAQQFVLFRVSKQWNIK